MLWASTGQLSEHVFLISQCLAACQVDEGSRQPLGCRTLYLNVKPNALFEESPGSLNTLEPQSDLQMQTKLVEICLLWALEQICGLSWRWEVAQSLNTGICPNQAAHLNLFCPLQKHCQNPVVEPWASCGSKLRPNSQGQILSNTIPADITRRKKKKLACTEYSASHPPAEGLPTIPQQSNQQLNVVPLLTGNQYLIVILT